MNDRNTALALALATLGLIAALALNDDFSRWAWARHHNPLSWYSRPLFLIPYCLAAWHRSWTGLAATLLLLCSSMFWFPAPPVPDPTIARFLAAERAWLAAPWTATQWLYLLTVITALSALAAVCWRRRRGLILLLLATIAGAKLLGSWALAGATARPLLAPALLGLVGCVAVLALALRSR